MNDQLTLTLGIRADKTNFTTDVPEDKFFNDTARAVIAQVYDLKALTRAEILTGMAILSRLGFKLNLDDEGVIVRGGIGVFGGRTPLVWPGGVYQNNGITIGALDTARTTGQLTAAGTQYGLQLSGQPVTFRPDVNNQYTQSDFRIVAITDQSARRYEHHCEKFHLPAVLRTSLGADKKFGNGWTVNFDVQYTKNLFEVDWKNVNIAPQAITTSGT